MSILIWIQFNFIWLVRLFNINELKIMKQYVKLDENINVHILV